MIKDKELSTSEKKPFNPGLIVAIILMALVTFQLLLIGWAVLLAAENSLVALAAGISLSLIAIALLVIMIFIILRKKATFLAVTITMILTIVLSLITAGVGAYERINSPNVNTNNRAYLNCLNEWDMERVEDADGYFLSYSYVNGDRTLDDYSDVAEECTAVAAEPLGANAIAMIIVQNFVLALIPSFAAILMWVYFKQSDRCREVLVK